jgi:adenylosuccinate synthase
MLNGATQLAITKIDLITPEAAGLKVFEELPKEAKEFIENIESKTNRPVTLIGTGPSTLDIIDRRNQ